jgi:hypothetical protein
MIRVKASVCCYFERKIVLITLVVTIATLLLVPIGLGLYIPYRGQWKVVRVPKRYIS